MGTPVDANGRSVLHKGHGQTHTCAVPDVCKTPSPAGPVPIPYINIAMDSNITDAAESVKIEGNPVANVSAKISTSTGDEPGSAGGIVSSKFKGTVTWKMGSLDVKAEGKSVVRFLDNAFHNGNSFNTAFIDMGGTGLAYGDDFIGPCEICRNGPAEHRILETPNSAELCADLIQELRRGFEAATTDEGRLRYARRKGKNKYKGYMVGVMICACGQKFAAMSGNDTLDGFADAVATVGANLVGGGIVSPQELAGANRSAGASAARKARVIDARVDELTTASNSQAGYNPPGNCAGAKLLGRSGHKPVQMTEAFSIVRATPFTYTVLRTNAAGAADAWLNQVLQNRFAQGILNVPEGARPGVEEDYAGDESIPSCHTCQDLLYLTMCPERNCG
jgi:uncharacterized protein DUF4150